MKEDAEEAVASVDVASVEVVAVVVAVEPPEAEIEMDRAVTVALKTKTAKPRLTTTLRASKMVAKKEETAGEEDAVMELEVVAMAPTMKRSSKTTLVDTVRDADRLRIVAKTTMEANTPVDKASVSVAEAHVEVPEETMMHPVAVLVEALAVVPVVATTVNVVNVSMAADLTTRVKREATEKVAEEAEVETEAPGTTTWVADADVAKAKITAVVEAMVAPDISSNSRCELTS